MKVAAGVLAAAVLFVAGVLIGTGGGRPGSHAPRVVELGRAPTTVSPTTGPTTTAPPKSAAPTTAAPPTTAPPVRSRPPATAPHPPQTVERRVEYGGLDDYSGKGSGSDSSGSGSGH